MPFGIHFVLFRSLLPTRLTVSATSAAVTAASAAATITAAAAVAAASAATAAATTFLGLGFVDLKLASVDLTAIDLFDSSLAFLARGHFHKSKSARTSGFAVFDNIGRFYRAEFAEEFRQVLRCGVK